MVEKYNYRTSDGFIDINTLSSNKEYFYLISKPKSLNPSLWGVKIAFFSTKGELIYYKKNTYACELTMNDNDYFFNDENDYKLPKHKIQTSLEFVKWAKDGNFIYFIEYKDNYSLTHKLIDLKKRKVYEKNATNDNLIVPKDFSIDLLRSYIVDFKEVAYSNDKFKRNGIFNKWYPDSVNF